MVEQVNYDELEPENYKKIAEAIGNANPVLDVGCGEGKLANFLATTLGKEVHGIDISDSKLAKAREAAEGHGISRLVHFVNADASSLDFLADKSFAAIVSIYTLHELENPRKALQELQRILGTGGQLIVVDFTKGGKAERLWGERYYTPEEIESMLQEAGFSEVAVEFVRDDVIFVSSLKI
jgi:ubiquinone/menaquinone biosynthesis C-methylase UbiE